LRKTLLYLWAWAEGKKILLSTLLSNNEREKGGGMKAVIVVKMKEGFLILPYKGGLIGIDPTSGRATERAGYDASKIGKAALSTFDDMEKAAMPTPAPHKEEAV
jgi:hypothetical protein